MNKIVIQIVGEIRRETFFSAPTPCEFALECDSFTVGSHPQTTPHVRIDNSTVSRRHLTVESVGNDGWRVRDAGSDNGTIVIDAPVDAPETVFSDENWHAACRRIVDFELAGPAMLLLGEVVVRLIPVTHETQLVGTAAEQTETSS